MSKQRWIAGMAGVMAILTLACASPSPSKNPPKKIGNVRLTFWLDQDKGKKTVTSYTIGGVGPKLHYCTNDCHWDATSKPGDHVTVTSDYYDIKAKGWLKIQVVQGNGHLLCEDDNNDTDRSHNVQCSGTVKV